jgi:two-component system chemotaxis sensor kinase CheA
VVLNAEGEIFGLIVDEILDTADIVVKPLSAVLKHLSLFSGATILGDGSIAIILDIFGLAQNAHINTQRSKEMDSGLTNELQRKKIFDTQEFLLVDIGVKVTHAIPLCLVQRLEEFSLSNIEFSGKQKVIRYRDQILPLLDLASILKYEKNEELNPNQKISAVVVQRSGKSYGICVLDIEDIVSVQSEVDDSIIDRDGILGNIVIQEKVIVIVDILHLIESYQHKGQKRVSELNDSSTKKSNMELIKSLNVDMKSKKVRVLYAEDVAFFRKHVLKVLNQAGFDVAVYEDGAKALAALDNSKVGDFNLILSDIEMPNMDGLEFAREVRKRQAYRSIPMIALTTRFKKSDIDAGINAGFTGYLEKLDPEKLLRKIAELMNLDVNDIIGAEA